MNEVYVFDLDGTLSSLEDSKKNNFADIFIPWIAKHKSYIVRSLKNNEARNLLGPEICDAVFGFFTST